MLTSLSLSALETTQIIKISGKYQEYPKELKHYIAFTNMHAELSDGELKEQILAVGILGARLLNLKKEYIKFKTILKGRYPQSIFLEKLKTQNLSKECAVCEGEKQSMRKCFKCKATKNCQNKSCKEGKVFTLVFGSGKAKKQKRTCTICEGTGNCATCEGRGEVQGACNTCNKKGYVFSPSKGFGALNETLQDIITSQKELGNKEFIQTLIAKGLILYKGEWMRRNQRDSLKDKEAEEVKLLALTLKKQREDADQQKINLRAHTLLKQFDKRLHENSSAFAKLLKNFIRDYPTCDCIIELKKGVSYCQLYTSGREYEKKGNYEKAISSFSKAQKLRHSKALAKRIKKLDDDSTGL